MAANLRVPFVKILPDPTSQPLLGPQVPAQSSLGVVVRPSIAARVAEGGDVVGINALWVNMPSYLGHGDVVPRGVLIVS